VLFLAFLSMSVFSFENQVSLEPSIDQMEIISYFTPVKEQAFEKEEDQLIYEFIKQHSKVSLNEANQIVAKNVEFLKNKSTNPQLNIAFNSLLAIAFYLKGDFENSIAYYTLNLNKFKSHLTEQESAKTMYNLGIIYYKAGKEKKAIEYLEQSLSNSQRVGFDFLTSLNYQALSSLYQQAKKYKEALSMYKTYVRYRYTEISRLNDQYETALTANLKKKDRELLVKSNTIKEIQQKNNELVVDTVKKSQEISLLSKEGEVKDKVIVEKTQIVKQQQITIIFITLVILIVLGFSVVLILQIKAKKKANALLKLSNDKIAKQRDEISEKNSEITNSIEYASRIQSAILGEPHVLSSVFSDYFVYYKPRDIVSGDFFWFNDTPEHLIIVLADCTGHGVPGAFMSMLGISMLESIVEKESIKKPDLIMNRLREDIIIALSQKENNKRKDGMDAVIVSINKDSMKIDLSCANNSVYVFKKNEFIEIKPDKMPVGDHPRMEPFSSVELDIQKGDSLYLFSDGLQDQFGGPENKKLKSKKIIELLKLNNLTSMKSQYAIIEKLHLEWMGDNDQTDDISMIGLRF